MLGNYSKLIGSIVGGVVGLLGAHLALPEELASPEMQGAITILLSAVATFFFPANKLG